MYYLKDHLIAGSYRNAYCDTDSMCIATSKTFDFDSSMDLEAQYRAIFDPIVRPEMRQSWEATWKSWFVTTTQVEDQRFPGKLKLEFGFKSGQFVALAPKTYMAFNADDPKNTKSGTKGIPHRKGYNMFLFLIVITWFYP